MNPVTALQLAEWRRETAALYAGVRGQADPAAAHALWRDGRGRLLRSHPQSPLPPGDPMRIRGVPYWPYDPALRWTVHVEPVTRPQDQPGPGLRRTGPLSPAAIRLAARRLWGS